MTRSTTRSPLVLLAEDNPDEQYVTRGLLEACGCRVVEAMNGEQAVSLALRERPDLILLDLRMPVLDGFEAAQRIRRHPGMDVVPMVAYTGVYTYSTTAHALEAGFDEYITKPVTLDDMRGLVGRYLPGGEEEGGKK